jgi:hypothetical protein
MTAQTKPTGLLNHTVKTKRPSNSSSANPPASIDGYERHNRHGEAKSKHYKEVVVGTTDTGQFGDRAVQKLNPNKAGPQILSYPGLAN